MKLKAILAVAVLSVAPAIAGANTISGLFNVTAVNITGVSGSDSQAQMSDYNAALTAAMGGASNAEYDKFTYAGGLDFRVPGPQEATQTIADWLSTGGGAIGGLDATFGGLQLSFPSVGAGTATTTFFLFERTSPLTTASFDVTHDDGFRIFRDGSSVGGVNGPTSERTTFVDGFGTGQFSLLYVATNGNPSILEVETVPLPAAAWMLLAGLGGLFGLRRFGRTV